jgi:hypothetical protein
MTTPKRKPAVLVTKPPEVVEETETKILPINKPQEIELPPPTGKIFLGEEDKRLLKKLNKHLVNKLGLGGSRSFKV